MSAAGDCIALLRRGLGALLLAIVPVLAPAVHAAGTPAGTLIGNTATLQYSISGNPPATASASSAAIVVAKVLQVVVTWQDAAPITANAPDTGRALTFVVTNTGNGAEPYRLARTDKVAGDQFDPAPAATGSLWLESGAQPGFQATGPNADIPYVPGSNDPSLPADGSRTVYVVSDIPAGTAQGAMGKSLLSATAATPGAAGAAPGTLVGTFGGVQTVVGAAASASAFGTYLVSGVSVGIAKSMVAARDPAGGTQIMSGSVLTYRIVVTVAGLGIAEAVSVSDPLPSSLAYVAGSVVVDGTARTDASDGDGISAAGNAITADFGNVTAPAQRVIEFKATVN